jgi:hypothetical protein
VCGRCERPARRPLPGQFAELDFALEFFGLLGFPQSHKIGVENLAEKSSSKPQCGGCVWP